MRVASAEAVANDFFLTENSRKEGEAALAKPCREAASSPRARHACRALCLFNLAALLINDCSQQQVSPAPRAAVAHDNVAAGEWPRDARSRANRRTRSAQLLTTGAAVYQCCQAMQRCRDFSAPRHYGARSWCMDRSPGQPLHGHRRVPAGGSGQDQTYA